MDKETYDKLLVVYKDFKDFFESDEMMAFQSPVCLEVLYRMLVKEMIRRKK